MNAVRLDVNVIRQTDILLLYEMNPVSCRLSWSESMSDMLTSISNRGYRATNVNITMAASFSCRVCASCWWCSSSMWR